MDVNGEVKLLLKFKTKKGGGSGAPGLGGQGGCEKRSEVFVKIIFFFLGGWGSGGGPIRGWGGGGGSKVWGRWVMWDMGDVNQE